MYLEIFNFKTFRADNKKNLYYKGVFVLRSSHLDRVWGTVPQKALMAGCAVKLPLFEFIWGNVVFLRFGKLNFLANCPIDLKKLFNSIFILVRLLFIKPGGLKRHVLCNPYISHSERDLRNRKMSLKLEISCKII